MVGKTAEALNLLFIMNKSDTFSKWLAHPAKKVKLAQVKSSSPPFCIACFQNAGSANRAVKASRSTGS